jgi:hypothetical protein
MHHFIYPTQDAYVSNKSAEIDKNFGLDEMLVVGVSQSYARVINYTKTYSYSNDYVSGMPVESFTGRFTGSAFLYSSISTGSIVGGYNNFSSGYFSGSLTGSVTGYETGSSFTSFNFSGSLRGFNGSIVANAIIGWVSGSLNTTCFSTFTGILNDATGSLTGYLTGDDIRDEQNTSIVNRRFIKRSLLKFDLSFISQSIVSGDITNPKFYLKMYITQGRELPVEYSVFTFPISQTWVQGDGYWSDAGGNEGVSWNWRNQYSGSVWFTPQRSDIITSSIDYLGNYGYVSESFLRGGGTWYNIPCSQSFSYESADLNIDVTSIVNAWLNQSVPNNGFIVMCSEETNPSGSNAHLFFFSRETNTIYSPHLDIAWDDSVWLTGSFGTGSVTITTYPPRFSGSISNGVSITGKTAYGSLSGNSFLITDQDGVIGSGSSILTYGNSETINGLLIEGNILGTSSLDINGTRFISASLTTGDFTGCQVEGEVSQSMITGFLSGSFNENVFLSYGLSGSIPTLHGLTTVALQNSSIGGSLLGYVYSSSFSGGTFSGVFVSGLLKGATAVIPFTGSHSYLTSSVAFTSSVVITGSSFSTISSEKPFVITIQNLKREYTFGDNPRINIFARENMPLKTFEKASQQSAYVKTKLLPSSSFYAIQDNETEEFVVSFDNYTKISCDLDGHYFDLNTSALEKERYYKIVIKVECLDGNVYTFDNNAIFQVRR